MPIGKLSRFIKEIQGHMRLRSSGDRHEIRQQYYSLLWQRLVKQLQVSGKEAVPEIIDLMDSYYLTKDDWDALLELGVGPMDMEGLKIDSQAKSTFTRLYNQQNHPLPYMKASQVIAPKKKDRERPDLEEAIEESDSGVESGADLQAVASDEEELDLKKDKYVKAPKKKAAAKPKGGGKGAGKAKGKKGKEDEDEDEMDVDESEEEVKTTKGKGKGKAPGGGGGRGRPKK